jgi:hypothetical protein
LNVDKTSQWLSIITNIGVLIGILLLVLELNQNTALMRAEMHAVRAEAKANRQIDLANSGEISRIMFEAFAAGFPQDQEALGVLTPEDRFRLVGFLGGLVETVQNWHYQCQQKLLDDELCRSGYESQAVSLITLTHAAGIDFSDRRASFIADLRRLAAEAGLPVPNEDGTWQE